MRESRIAIAWLSLPPEELMAGERSPRSRRVRAIVVTGPIDGQQRMGDTFASR